MGNCAATNTALSEMPEPQSNGPVAEDSEIRSPHKVVAPTADSQSERENFFSQCANNDDTSVVEQLKQLLIVTIANGGDVHATSNESSSYDPTASRGLGTLQHEHQSSSSKMWSIII